MVIVPAIWAFCALMIALFGCVAFIGLVYFVMAFVFYWAIFFLRRAVNFIMADPNRLS